MTQRIQLAIGWLSLVAFVAQADAPEAADRGRLDAAAPYAVQPGDQLVIHVWREPDLSGEVLVRPDGGVSAPLIGDLQAAGKAVADIADQVRERLLRYIPDPAVSVSVKDITGNRFYVVGKVIRSGEFLLTRPIDVMQALSLAGGMTPFAAPDKILVLRRDAGGTRSLPFRYSEVERGEQLDQNVFLNPGDTVVVP